jgi:hypothetical protein
MALTADESIRLYFGEPTPQLGVLGKNGRRREPSHGSRIELSRNSETSAGLRAPPAIAVMLAAKT